MPDIALIILSRNENKANDGDGVDADNGNDGRPEASQKQVKNMLHVISSFRGALDQSVPLNDALSWFLQSTRQPR